ncbi:MAG: hypothetical protein WAW86_10670 [Gammaproteobacteria bacterium]
MKPQKNEDQISKILNDAEKVREIIQLGIHAALLKHKQAGNPVCTWKNGKVFWIQPENIHITKK